MKPRFEPPRARASATSFSAYERTAERFDFHWHYHPEFELTCVLASAGERLVGDHVARYRPGDLVLLGSNLPHSWHSDPEPAPRARHRAIVVQFLPAVIPAPLLELPEFRAVRDLLARSARGLAFPGGGGPGLVARLRRLPRLEGLPAWLELLRCLAELAARPRVRPLASVTFAPQTALAGQEQLQRALRHIDTHNEPDLALPDVARAAGVSAATLARLFRRYTGRSFVAYVNELRVALVCRGLIESPRGIAEIAYAAGFNNLANFNRCFRRQKRMSPSRFRARYAYGSANAT